MIEESLSYWRMSCREGLLSCESGSSAFVFFHLECYHGCLKMNLSYHLKTFRHYRHRVARHEERRRREKRE